ncbi:MAG: YdcF family protein [Erythrobacter sp.]
MILRFVSALLLVYAFGFLGFAVSLPKPVAGEHTDAVIVLTGGAGRIARGIEVVDEGLAKQLFVSGVDPEVTEREFAAEFKVPRRLMNCCVTLGYLAVDTRSNAGEAAEWLKENEFSSVRLVTTDWHMARASSEFTDALPEGMVIVRDAVKSDPDLATLYLEYNKLLAAAVSQGLPV